MTLKRNSKDEIVITLSPDVDVAAVEEVMDYLRYLEITSKSKATPASALKMAAAAKRTWWSKNRKRYLA